MARLTPSDGGGEGSHGAFFTLVTATGTDVLDVDSFTFVGGGDGSQRSAKDCTGAASDGIASRGGGRACGDHMAGSCSDAKTFLTSIDAPRSSTSVLPDA